jgi:hypothetical protein
MVLFPASGHCAIWMICQHEYAFLLLLAFILQQNNENTKSSKKRGILCIKLIRFLPLIHWALGYI